MSQARKIQRLKARDGGGCHYCKKSLFNKDITLDHKLARRWGGTDDDENMVISCKPCNWEKADMPYGEFVSKRKPRFLGLRKQDGTFLEPRQNFK